MANVNSVTDGFFVTAQEGFVTTTGGSISAGASTVSLNSVAGYNDGDYVVLVVDPTDATKKQAFTGEIDTAGNQVINVEWTEGDNTSHSAGATVVDYETATAWALYAKGMRVSHETDGSLKTQAVKDALGISGDTPPDYNTIGTLPNSMTYNGNRSYDVVFPGVNLTTTLSPGSRLRFTRTTAAPTQCTSLNGTNQYYSKTTPAGMTFTDDFVVSAWVKLSSYPASAGVILSRNNGTSGWNLYINANGTVQVDGYNGSSSNVSNVKSYQSVPLNKWVHIAVQLDMSAFTASTTTSFVMLDGVDVPATVARGGTNPTALVQAGNLEIGSQNGGTLPFPGKIAQVAIYNSKVTQANIRNTISQGLAGTETSLISAYSFNNSINDLNTTNGNNLTANGSAVATNADSPFGGQSDGTISSNIDYGIVQKAAFSTNTTVTVQVPEGNTITTTGAISAVSYSNMKAPYGMPTQKNKWSILMLNRVLNSQAAPASGTWYNVGSLQLNVPVGEWNAIYQMSYGGNSGGLTDTSATLSTANNTELDPAKTIRVIVGGGGNTIVPAHRQVAVSQSTQAQIYLNVKTQIAMTNLYVSGNDGGAMIIAENAYL